MWPGIRYLGKPNREGWSSYQDAVAQLDDERIVISSESMSGSLTEAYLRGGGWVEDFHQRLDTLSDRYGSERVGVLVGLRRHEAWLASIYKHYIKYGGTAAIADFIGASGIGPASPFDESDLLLSPRIAAIRRTFPAEPFVFFVEELTESPRGLAADLASYLGTSVPDEIPLTRRFNEGVGTVEAGLLRRLNAWSNREHGGHAPNVLERIDRRPFKRVRRLTRLRVLPRGREVQLDAATAHRIRECFRGDLTKTVAAVEEVRPGYTPPSAVRRAMGP